MKKTSYQRPEMDVLTISIESHLLAGTNNDDPDTPGIGGGEIGTGDDPLPEESRAWHSVFGDDDEE